MVYIILKDTVAPTIACSTFIWLTTISSTAAKINRIRRKGDITAVNRNGTKVLGL